MESQISLITLIRAGRQGSLTPTKAFRGNISSDETTLQYELGKYPYRTVGLWKRSFINKPKKLCGAILYQFDYISVARNPRTFNAIGQILNPPGFLPSIVPSGPFLD